MILLVIVIVMLARDCYNSLSLITEISQIRNYNQIGCFSASDLLEYCNRVVKFGTI